MARRWTVIEASGIGGVIEAPDALAALQTYWAFHHVGPTPSTIPDTFTVRTITELPPAPDRMGEPAC